jgi:hypothetical protein
MDTGLPHIDPNKLNDISSLKGAVVVLMNIVEEQHQTILKIKDENRLLKDEVNHLKGEHGRPDIKANSKPTGNNISSNGKEKEPKAHKKQAKKANIKVDKTEHVKIESDQLPADAEFKYWDEVVTQDIVLERRNILYKVAVYYSPSQTKTYRAQLPEGKGYHSDELKSFIIMLNKVCDVTSKKILTMLHSFGFEVSAGSLSSILLEHTDLAEAEKTAILKAGLSHPYSQTDITGARVAGKNHYVHIITNEHFTTYTTLAGKSTLDVLAAFQAHSDKKGLGLIYSDETVRLLEKEKVSARDRASLEGLLDRGQKFTLQGFEAHIKEKLPGLFNKRNIFIKVKTAFALAYYHFQDKIPKVYSLVSDNAPEYNRIALTYHALCWVHDARAYNKLTPFVDVHKDILAGFMDKYWSFYQKLLEYKKNPGKKLAAQLSTEFDQVFQPCTGYFQLNQCISKTAEKKQELLVVLSCPQIPLHNNLSELAARQMARKRDISLHTMTTKGTKNQDAFMTIVQTSLQLGVDVYKYIKELVAKTENRVTLADLIYQKINCAV